MKIIRKFTVLVVALLLGDTLWATDTLRRSAEADRDSSSGQSVELGLLGPGDEVTLRDFDLDELNGKVFQVGEDGTIGLPMAGRVQAAGLTVGQLEVAVNERLKVYVKEPKTTIASVQYRSRPVSVLGAVNNPGVYQLSQQRSLVQVLAAAGGLRTDSGSWLIVTRKGSVNPSVPDPTGTNFSAGVTEIRIPTAGILNGTDPRASMPIQANDVVSVGKAELVYVMGDVKKPGGFVLGEHEELSLVKVLSLAEGYQLTASLGHARILREANGTITEIPVDIKKILDGKASNMMLQPEDVLYVPTSMAKRVASRSIEAAIQAGVGIVVWRR